MIRQATVSDVPAIKEIMRSEPGFWQEHWPDDVIERGITASSGLAYVWEEGGTVRGFVCAADQGFRGYLTELIVAGPYRSRGIGKQLLGKIEKELKSRGCTVLISDVWRDAEGFYKSLGWSEPEAKLLRKRLDDESNQGSK